MSSLTPAQEALRALAEKATKGEWACEFVGGNWFVDAKTGENICMLYPPAANAAFIAAANPAAVLALLDELAAVRGALAKYGQHERVCPATRYRGGVCNCGWAARAHLATPADLSLATEDFPLGRCHRCGEPIADQDKGNEGCEDPHCPTLP